MSLVGSIVIGATLDTSVFNAKLKDVADGLKSTFGLNQKQANSVAGLEMKLRQQAETFGMTANQIAIYKLKMQGVSPAALKTAQSLQRVIEKMEAQKRAQDQVSGDSKILGFGKGLAMGLAGVVAGATGAATGLALYAKSALGAADDTGDLAQRLGAPSSGTFEECLPRRRIGVFARHSVIQKRTAAIETARELRTIALLKDNCRLPRTAGQVCGP